MWKNNAIGREALGLRTDRLLIKPCSALEAASYLAILRRNRQHIASYMPDEILSIDNVEDAGNFLASLAQGWDQGAALCFAALLVEEGDFVAQIYVQPIDRHAGIVEIGYFSDVAHQGQGFVSEAVRRVTGFLFEEVGVHKVCLITDEGNHASARVADRCGYRLEGVLRQHALNKDGSRPDRRFYARLRDEA